MNNGNIVLHSKCAYANTRFDKIKKSLKSRYKTSETKSSIYIEFKDVGCFLNDILDFEIYANKKDDEINRYINEIQNIINTHIDGFEFEKKNYS